MNILYFFENGFKKTWHKKRHFQEKHKTRFSLNMEVERKETNLGTKTIVYKSSNMSIQHKTVHTSISFVVSPDFLFLNQSSSLIVTISYPGEWN